ncbi:hypothetical protein TSUD_32000 [Trifolium subterraneum]|uniref:Uncharacterized protein n=1 Tax=Trifolium subterraneum TaxID=3900 RepID=A0A2Z6MHT4_TRISU|nr:hypothetical protein TSUD_32000 [Trifolium subterraneum]
MESGRPLLQESSFISKDMESNLPLLQVQSFESLIQKYPPLPLRSSEEIQQEHLELDSPFNNNVLESMFNASIILDDSNGNLHSCEATLVDENGMKPTYMKNDESNNEDLIDLLDGLGWLDGYIF